MWIRMGRWTRDPEYGTGSPERPGEPEWPSFFRTPADFPNLTAGLLAYGMTEDEVAAILGGNWLRLFRQAFEPA
jgi:membrane dipeptidase